MVVVGGFFFPSDGFADAEGPDCGRMAGGGMTERVGDVVWSGWWWLWWWWWMWLWWWWWWWLRINRQQNPKKERERGREKEGKRGTKTILLL